MLLVLLLFRFRVGLLADDDFGQPRISGGGQREGAG